MSYKYRKNMITNTITPYICPLLQQFCVQTDKAPVSVIHPLLFNLNEH
jgi:hypothetical protein